MMSNIHPLRVIAKAVVIFVLLNVLYAVINPSVGRLSVYNWLVKGRERLPRGGGATRYNLYPEDLDALMASHVVAAGRRDPAEFRVLVLGDSATWGPFLAPSENFVGQLNAAHLNTCDRHMRFFNLAYPAPSVLKDFIILDRGRQYEPDLVVWMLTSASFEIVPPPPIWASQSNAAISALLREYNLRRYQKFVGPPPTFLERTILGERGRLARLARLQIYGFLWGATGIDLVQTAYEPVAQRLVQIPNTPPEPGSRPAASGAPSRAWDILHAARRLVGPVPVLIVDQPLFLGMRKGSESLAVAGSRRQAFEEYQRLLQKRVAQEGWSYLDLHDAVLPSEFTDTVHHLNASGEAKVARALADEIQTMSCP